MVTGQSQHGIDTKACGRENIAHNGHTVTVTAGHLQNGLNAGLLQLDTKAQTGCLQAGGLHIRYIHTVNLALQKLGSFHLLCKIISLRGCHFGSYTKLAGFQRVFQNAHYFFPLIEMVLG